MISFNNGVWSSSSELAGGSLVFEETPILVCPNEIPSTWRKIAKKISKLEPDRKPEDALDTMPSWEQVTLNEAIARLVYAFDALGQESKDSILEMRSVSAAPHDSPFASLIKKAKQVLTKDGIKAGLSKSTVAALDSLLCILTTKVCVTLDGGAVLFRNLGTIPHSCTPNCMFIPRSGNVGHLVAIRDIKSDEPITCSHIPTNCLRANVETRQAWLRGIAGSRCLSPCCNAGYDLRRRVICPKCHPSKTRAELDKNDQSDICFAAKSNVNGLWKGIKCGIEMPENEAIDLGKEASVVKKILILNEADVDIARLTQYTNAAIQDTIRVFGKGHFCYQQLLLLSCGLALHSLCGSVTAVKVATAEQRSLFVSWTKMLIDVVNFSLETELPFAGMDELVRIIIAPETLQMALKIMTSTRKDDPITVEYVATFNKFVEQSSSCLVLIEGSESVHSQDALKLKNWWAKKYNSWNNTPDPAPQEVKQTADASFVSTTGSESVILESPKSSQVNQTKLSLVGRYAFPIAVTSAVIVSGFALMTMYRRGRK